MNAIQQNFDLIGITTPISDRGDKLNSQCGESRTKDLPETQSLESVCLIVTGVTYVVGKASLFKSRNNEGIILARKPAYLKQHCM